jgi:hypothetical protein
MTLDTLFVPAVPERLIGGRAGTCNGQAAGVGCTRDDDPALAHPAHRGYLDPAAFVESHRPREYLMLRIAN